MLGLRVKVGKRMNGVDGVDGGEDVDGKLWYVKEGEFEIDRKVKDNMKIGGGKKLEKNE